jgi:hypothetical protein
VHQGLPKFPIPQSSAGQTNIKGKANKRRSYLDVVRLSFIWVPYLHKLPPLLYPAPSGELRAAEGRTYDVNESEARRVWVQRVST